MDRKKWYAIATLVGGATALAIYLAPLAKAEAHLKPMGANAIFRHSWASLRTDSFGETLTYQNSLLPPQVNLARLINLPVPDGSVTTINLYQNSPHSWRFEEINQADAVVGVVARDHNQLVTYQGQDNQRTISTLPAALQSPWTLWQIPAPGTWEKDWSASTAVTHIGNLPAYQVTLTPRVPGTLWGSVTYWFQGQYFVPLGVRVRDQSGSTVFSVKAAVFTEGSPGSSASPPSAGTVVAWHVSPALNQVTHQLAGSSNALPPAPFPRHLGPLIRTSQRKAGDNAIAVYGTGPGRVLVLSTPAKVWTGRRAQSFLRPIRGSAQFRGVTDGVFSVVTFRRNRREITLMGSRTQTELARWAQSEWR